MKTKIIFIFILILATLKSNGQIISSVPSPSFDDGGFYLIPTVFISAINVTTTAIEIHRLRNPDKPDKYRTNAIFAILSGTLQTALGVSNVGAKYKNAYIPTSLNIGIGATTIVTSILRLARKKTPKETKMSYNFFYMPHVDRLSTTVGIRLIRKFN